jgi:hypothetical protein
MAYLPTLTTAGHRPLAVLPRPAGGAIAPPRPRCRTSHRRRRACHRRHLLLYTRQAMGPLKPETPKLCHLRPRPPWKAVAAAGEGGQLRRRLANHLWFEALSENEFQCKYGRAFTLHPVS